MLRQLPEFYQYQPVITFAQSPYLPKPEFKLPPPIVNDFEVQVSNCARNWLCWDWLDRFCQTDNLSDDAQYVFSKNYALTAEDIEDISSSRYEEMLHKNARGLAFAYHINVGKYRQMFPRWESPYGHKFKGYQDVLIENVINSTTFPIESIRQQLVVDSEAFLKDCKEQYIDYQKREFFLTEQIKKNHSLERLIRDHPQRPPAPPAPAAPIPQFAAPIPMMMPTTFPSVTANIVGSQPLMFLPTNTTFYNGTQMVPFTVPVAVPSNLIEPRKRAARIPQTGDEPVAKRTRRRGSTNEPSTSGTGSSPQSSSL